MPTVFHAARLIACAVTLASAAAAQTPPDSLRALPPYSRTVRGDFRPPQTSALRAFAYSAAATGGMVAVGTLAILAAPSDVESDAGNAVTGIGAGVIFSGLLFGPAVGNLSLGAGADIERSVRLKLRVLTVGGAVVLTGVGAGLTCILDAGPASDCGVLPAATVLVVGGAGVMAAGVVAGAVYDLATIPGNARWARRARANGNRVPVAVWPGYDARGGGPVLAVRVDL